MPKYQLRIQAGTTRLHSRFKELNFIENKLKARVSNVSEETNRFIKNAINVAIRKHRVYRALTNPPLGVRGADLVAEFGLTNSEAAYLMETELMTILLDKATKINVAQTFKENSQPSPGVRVKLTGYYLSPAKYTRQLTREPFYYHSRKQRSSARKKQGFQTSTYKIQWMKWLLEAHRGNNAIYSTLSNVKDYGITYDVGPGMGRFSRSGRAIMLKNTAANRRRLAVRYFPYTMPEIARPRAGAKNFIDEVATDKAFVSNLDAGVKKIFNDTLKLGR